jgi:hypothetical protein
MMLRLLSFWKQVKKLNCYSKIVTKVHAFPLFAVIRAPSLVNALVNILSSVVRSRVRFLAIVNPKVERILMIFLAG